VEGAKKYGKREIKKENSVHGSETFTGDQEGERGVFGDQKTPSYREALEKTRR